jgi:hypothetical protein
MARDQVVEPARYVAALASPSLAHVARCCGFLLLCVSALAYIAWLASNSLGPPMADFADYYAAGQTWSHGGDPYGVGIWNIEQTLPGFDSSRIELLPFVGPPLSLPLWAAFGALPFAGAAIAWGVVLVASAVAIMVLPARLAEYRIRPGDIPSLLLLVVSSGPIVTGISAGQAALPAVAAVIVVVWCAARRRWILMAAAAIVAGLLKPNDALVIVATLREAVALCVAAGSAIVSGLANLQIAHGLHRLIAYLGVIANQGEAERTFTNQLAPTSIAYGFGMTRQAAGEFGTVLSVLAAGTVVAAVRATRADLTDGAAISCAMLPFVLPYEHVPDMAVVLLPALLVVFRARGRTWALGATGTVLLFINPFALTQGWPGTTFAVTMAAVAALQLAALAPPVCKPVRFVPLAIAPLVLVLGLFAPAERLPIWPGEPGPRVVVTPGASPSAIWNAELVALQLDTQRPWVSLVRLLTLAGCACIGIAMVRTAVERSAHSASRAEEPGSYGVVLDAVQLRNLAARKPDDVVQHDCSPLM